MRRQRRRSVAGSAPSLLCLIALVLPGFRAEAEIFASWGSWAQLVAEGDFGFVDSRLGSIRLWLEGQSRWNEDWRHWYQGVARTALGYSFSERATIWLGYNYVPTQLQGKPSIAQQDVFSGFRYVLPTAYGTLMFRTLLDVNFIRGDDPRYRPRQLIRYLRPFAFEPRLSLVAWDEFFIRLNSTQWGGQAGFDQNRVFLGLGWTFNSSTRAELGYLNQYAEDPRLINETDNHLILGSLFVSW